jgi:hypothetical protein
MMTFGTIMISDVPFTAVAEAAAKAPTVTESKKTLYVGYKTYQITYKDLSKNASVTYKSSNTKYAKVSSKGVVTPVAAGKATITATVKQDKKTYSLMVAITVKNPYISMTTQTDKLLVSETFTFKAKTYGLSSTKIAWSVSDKKIATIASDGKLSAKKAGTVKVYAKADGKTASCTVSITQKKKYSSAEEIYQQFGQTVVDVVGDDLYNGAGFFIGPGVIITNYHTIKDAEQIKVYPDGRGYFYADTILGYDEELDIAIIQINCENDSLTLSKDTPKEGDIVYRIAGIDEQYEVLSTAIISKIATDEHGNRYMQLKTNGEPGSNGGPILNEYGEVIAISSNHYYDFEDSSDDEYEYYYLIEGLDKIDTDHPISIEDHYKELQRKYEEEDKAYWEEYLNSDPAGINDRGKRIYLEMDTDKVAHLLPREHDHYWMHIDHDTTLGAIIALSQPEDLLNVDIKLYDASGNFITESSIDTEKNYHYFVEEIDAGDYYIAISPAEEYSGYGLAYVISWSIVY